MNDLNPTEKKFEDYIEKRLRSAGYTSSNSREYDKNLCLIKDEVINFIKSTQQEKWNDLCEIYGTKTENKLLARISLEISQRGIIDVFLNQIEEEDITIDLCYFKPKNNLNPDHRNLFESNEFTVVRQLHYSSHNENSIDMVLFLNGLPIITMELKNQLSGQYLKNAEDQYKNDRDPNEPLLKFKRCMVHFCVDNDKASMTTRLSGQKTRFLPYNQGLENPPVKNGYRTNYLWEDILTPNSVLDILENFVHVSKEKEFFFNEKIEKVESKEKELLIFPRYHQLDLIRKLRSQLIKDGVGKKYLVQHTTGSGKSYSIGWLSHILTSLYKSKGDTKRMFDTIVVVTDRTVLDDQLRRTIKSLEKVGGVVNGVEAGSKQLKEYLDKGKPIVITTIQKFPFISATISSLGGKNFAVIIDEVHSSQSGELSKELKKSLSKKSEGDGEAHYEEILHQEIKSRGQQKHISFFGFTGTPKKKTLELFGTKNKKGQFEPFHIYSMHQSIHEKFTLDVLQNYITYKRYFNLKKTSNDDIRISTAEGKRQLVKYVDSDKRTITYKVNIILDHWINFGAREIQGKSRGMIVTQSRKQCVLYHKEINRQLKERGIHYHCLVGFSDEVDLDGKKHSERGLNRSIGYKGANVPHGLKDPKYRLLVVANKFQTGFDEPLVQSMYVDKKLGGVQCVQTLSRLNRNASSKNRTFVLDFNNDPDDVRKSFQPFYKSIIFVGKTDPNRIGKTLKEIYAFHIYTKEDVNRFCKVFYDQDRDEGELHSILDPVVKKFKSIKGDKHKEGFKSKIKSYIREYGYLSQIMNSTDVEFEKSFIFLKYLYKKLPKFENEPVDVSDMVDLKSLRIQKIYENREDSNIDDIIPDLPTTGKSGSDGSPKSEQELLSEIIKEVNRRYGSNLTEKDQLALFHLSDLSQKSTKLKKFMHDGNTDDSKRSYFKREFENMMIDDEDKFFDLYKKLDKNPEMKNFLLEKMYLHLNNRVSQSSKS